ncbi:MAG: 4Fe-4S binding protein, partial [Clostridia bacterium]|nr:4Fe-4S binding protein [Clostridia bacterium]
NTCPKHLIELIPKSSLIYVACVSTCKGKEVMDACKKGCIGCGICAKFCPNGAIEMIDNHPVIDYLKCNGCKTCVAKCPRKCIKEI